MTFYIASDNNSHWRFSHAKTLSGAKVAATYFYGKKEKQVLEIGFDDGSGQIVRVSVKRGFQKWKTVEQT